MSSWFIRTHEVDPNSTTIYRILRTRTVAFLGGGGGFKGPGTACQTGNIIRWLYNCNTFRKEKKGVILKALYKQIKHGKVQLYAEISSFIVFKSFARMNCIELFHL